jgi:hypothetical protein
MLFYKNAICEKCHIKFYYERYLDGDIGKPSWCVPCWIEVLSSFHSQDNIITAMHYMKYYSYKGYTDEQIELLFVPLLL